MNKSNSFTKYIDAHVAINDFLIHKLIYQNKRAQINKKIVNFHNENFLFFNKYTTGNNVEIKAQTTTFQFARSVNIEL